MGECMLVIQQGTCARCPRCLEEAVWHIYCAAFPHSLAHTYSHRWLKEGPDGLYRAEPTFWEENPDALIPIRSQFFAEGARNAKELGAGWKLLTLKSKILDTVD